MTRKRLLVVVAFGFVVFGARGSDAYYRAHQSRHDCFVTNANDGGDARPHIDIPNSTVTHIGVARWQVCAHQLPKD